MSEENDTNSFEDYGSDDMSVLRALLYMVKGLSPVSAIPELEIAEGEFAEGSEFEFE